LENRLDRVSAKMPDISEEPINIRPNLDDLIS